MQLVAASRMRRAQEAVEAARPYADEISRVIRRLTEASAPETLPAVLRPRPVTRVAYVVMTTNRGLVGPLNTNMVRLGLDRIADAATEVSVIVIGRKGQASLQRAGAAGGRLYGYRRPADRRGRAADRAVGDRRLRARRIRRSAARLSGLREHADSAAHGGAVAAGRAPGRDRGAGGRCGRDLRAVAGRGAGRDSAALHRDTCSTARCWSLRPASRAPAWSRCATRPTTRPN